jgi:ribonuclease J
LVLDGAGQLIGEPQITIHGLASEASDADALIEAAAAGAKAVMALPHAKRAEDANVKEAARVAIRRALSAHYGKKPVTDVHLVRLPHIS